MSSRYVLTRMWFSISIGSYGHDSSAWTESRVVDVQEVPGNQVWRVYTQRKGISEAFYVVGATCEVIGHVLPRRSTKVENECSLRPDWSAYLTGVLSVPSSATLLRTSLLDRIHWSNCEDYERGISKLWLRRISREGDLGDAKRCIAERYILASVVANR